MAERVAALVLVVAIGLWAELRPGATPVDGRVPHGQCQPWMADSLPGIGPKTRAEMADAIRAGEVAALPATARAMARAVFRFDVGD